MARNLADLIPAVFTGPNGQPLTEAQIRSRQLIARSLLQNATDTSPTAGGWASVLSKGVQGFAAGYQNRSADRGAQANLDATKASDADFWSAISPSLAGGSIPSPAAGAQLDANTPAIPSDLSGNDVYNQFISTVKAGGLTNPYGLAAVAATGRAESGYDPGNVMRTWSDPSESGQQGTAGGILSWRGPRYAALKATGDLSPAGQAKFFLQEDPKLVAALQGAKSIEEAQQAINNAWAFRGYNRPGGESARRLGYAKGFLPSFQTEVASAAPQTATDAIAAVSAPSGYVDPKVTTAYQAPIPVTSAPIAPVGQAQTVADPTIAPAQEISPVAQALVAPMKGDRLGATTSQNFNDRFGSSAPEQVAPEIYSQPGDFLRPFNANERRPNPDGSYSTEISTTWQLPDGSWTNIPSLWMGPNGPQQFDPNDEENILGAAASYEMRNGQTFSRFPTEQEAVKAAEARSAAGGAGAGAPTQSRTPIAFPQPQLPTVQPLNPAVIKALSSPYASPQTKAVAESLLKQNMAQRQAVEERRLKIQQQQQALQQRQAVAQSLGIDPTLAGDDEAWKQAVGGGSLINAGDGNLYDSRTRQWITAPNSGNKNFRQATPEEVKTYGTNGQVGPDGKFYPITPPQGTSLSVDPNTGAVSFNQGAGVKPLTEGQSKDTFFNTRMEAALPTLEANENALLNLGGKVADAIPMNLGNYAQSEDYQLARDAGRDFVTAYLRKDSGAAITPQEEKVYGELLLPQPGDKPSAIEAKRQRRRVAIEAIKAGMPQQALDNALKAIKASGGDKAIVPTEIPGVTIRRVN